MFAAWPNARRSLAFATALLLASAPAGQASAQEVQLAPVFELRAAGDMSPEDRLLLAAAGEPIAFNYPLDRFLVSPRDAVRAATDSICNLDESGEAIFELALARNADLLAAAADGRLDQHERQALARSDRLTVYGLSSRRTYVTIQTPFCVRVNASTPIVIRPGDTIDNILDAGQYGPPSANYSEFAFLNRGELTALSVRDPRCQRRQTALALLHCLAPQLEPGDTFVQNYAPRRSFQFSQNFAGQWQDFQVSLASRALTEQFEQGPAGYNPVRLMRAVSRAAGGQSCVNAKTDVSIHPLNPEAVWIAIMRQYELVGAAERRSSVVGIVDTGLAGAGSAHFPDGLFALKTNPSPQPTDDEPYFDDRYGAGLRFTGNIEPVASDPERDHGTGVANLVFGGAVLRQRLTEHLRADPNFQSPVRMRIFSLAREGPSRPLSLSDAIDGVDYLAHQSNAPAIAAAIVNLSLEQPDPRGRMAQQIGHLRSVLFVAAAGNGESQTSPLPRNLYTSPIYPAAYGGTRNINVITVTALRPDGERADFANFASQRVDIAAHGCAMSTLDAGLNPHRVSGTSFAAPLVSFAAALIRSFSPRLLLPAEIKARLILSADLVPGLAGWVAHGAVLNIERAISVNSDVLVWNGQIYFGAYSTPADLGSICPRLGTVPGQRLRVAYDPARRDYEVQRGYVSSDGEAVFDQCRDDLPVQALSFVTDSNQTINLRGQSFDLLMRLRARA